MLFVTRRSFATFFAAALLCFIARAQAGQLTAQPEKSALVIVDAQIGVLSTVWDSARIIRNIESLVAKARAKHVPVFWVQHQDDDELKLGSKSWKLDPHFKPTANEVVIHKRFNSSFAETDLGSRLKLLGIKRIVLAGAATNWCIRSTAYATLDRGYDLTLVSDAHSTESLNTSDGTVVPAKLIVADLNTVMQWISAPGVKTEVKPTAEIRF
ncbi:isochorismatase family protein [Rhodanobacter umsongensis]|uniref:Isochorismatase family protein n=1 Tax=Rhodanobacter umsongensis TaxID=633153 RepID=A0ABW0JKL9_9GAMM